MITNLSRLFAVACLLAVSATASAGPDPVQITTPDRQAPVVKWHQKLVQTVLVACGVVEPPPVYVAPGYLETIAPAPMLVYRPAAAMHPRRVSQATIEEKPTPAVPAANAAPSPTGAPPPLPAATPVNAPVPNPAPLAPDATSPDAEPGILPENDPRGSSARSHTDEMLSYFQRQHAVARPYTASPVSPGEGGPNDSAAEPSFLQAPQAPEQPVLPPSRATYHVAP